MIKAPNGQFLNRVLDPVASSLNVEAARKLVGLRADKRTQARVAVLARKCNEGLLTTKERAEYEAMVLTADVIAILQAKAQILLGRRGKSA